MPVWYWLFLVVNLDGDFSRCRSACDSAAELPPKVWPEYISGFGVLMVGISNTDPTTKVVGTLAIGQKVIDLF